MLRGSLCNARPHAIRARCAQVHGQRGGTLAGAPRAKIMSFGNLEAAFRPSDLARMVLTAKADFREPTPRPGRATGRAWRRDGRGAIPCGSRRWDARSPFAPSA